VLQAEPGRAHVTQILRGEARATRQGTRRGLAVSAGMRESWRCSVLAGFPHRPCSPIDPPHSVPFSPSRGLTSASLSASAMRCAASRCLLPCATGRPSSSSGPHTRYAVRPLTAVATWGTPSATASTTASASASATAGVSESVRERDVYIERERAERQEEGKVQSADE